VTVPVEIKELVIRAVVAPLDEHPPRRAAAPTGPEAAGQEAVIEAAVKEVLRVLRASKER
jgi:hypothetical protein